MALRGAREHIARLKRLASPATQRRVGQALFVAADRIKATAQQSITAGSVSGANHVASKPGEPPNADTRVLDRNIEAVSKGPFLAEVSSNAPHAAAMELGNSRVAARPHIAPARDKHRGELADLVAQAINAESKG